MKLKGAKACVIKLILACSALVLALGRDTVQLQLKNLKDSDRELKIAFGSCYGLFNQWNNIFEVIANTDPHVWMWTGDVAYTDNVRSPGKTLYGIIEYSIVKPDGGMPLEYYIGRLNKTKSDICKHFDSL